MTSQDQIPVSRGGFLSTIVGKITLRMLLVAAIPVLAVGALTVGSLFALANRANERLESNRAELTTDTFGANHVDQAELVLSRMNSHVNERIGDIVDWSRAEAMVSAAAADYPELEELDGLQDSALDARFDPDYRLDTSGRSNRWLRTQISDQATYSEAVLTDSQGLTVAYANGSTDFTNADQEWWTEAWANGVFLGPVAVDDETGLLEFDIAVRVDDLTTRGPLGVLMVTVDAASLQPFADEVADEATETTVNIFSGSGLLVAETATGHDPSRVASEMPFEAERAEAYNNALSSSDLTGVLSGEDSVGGFARTAPALFVPRLDTEVDNHDWIAFVEQPSTTALQPLDGLESLSSDLSNTARVLTMVIAGLVIASLLLAFLLARLLAKRIARPINQLRVEANRLADRELPRLVTSLQASDASGEIPMVTPITVEAEGEVAELAAAFNSVRTTAVELAAEQAIGRTKDVSNVLLNLGRRNQQLVGRQLRFIDDLERSESDPDTLRSLFVLDQMATRMRRNAESLLVLAGEDSPRRVSEPKQAEEVVRAASGEVEDYARVRLASTDSTLIQPRIVNDLTHLLAELIENATNFSPPDELVEVAGRTSADGSYAISIVDRGVGIPAERLKEANVRLRDPAFSGGDSTSSFLGLYVVARLAARHNIDVQLHESDSSGITATVMLPPEAIAHIPKPVTDVTGSTLRDSEGDGYGAAPAPSWPPPKVEHAPRLPVPRSRPTPVSAGASATEAPAPAPSAEPNVGVAASETTVGPEVETEVETEVAAELGAANDTDPATSSPPAIELPQRPGLGGLAPPPSPPAIDLSGAPDQTGPLEAASGLGLRSPDSGSLVPPPVGPQRRQGEATTPSDTDSESGSTTEVVSEDETSGLPIPPFRARQSNRPVGEPEEEAPVADAEADAREDGGTFHVRRRVRPLGTTTDQGLEPVSPPVSQDEGAAKSRADEVRQKLMRFASGVEAARRGAPPIDQTDSSEDAVQAMIDNNGSDTGSEGVDGDTSGNGHETVQD